MELRLLRFWKSYLHCSILHPSTASILSMADVRYSGERSHPSHLLVSCSAATAVVPDPTNGSNTTSSALEEANMILRNNSSGFCVGCDVFSCMPLQVVGISITSFGFAPLGLGSHWWSFPLPYWLVAAWGCEGYFSVWSEYGIRTLSILKVEYLDFLKCRILSCERPQSLPILALFL